MISEGCSACACGIESACNSLYFPAFTLPGSIVLIGLLIVIFVLIRKKILSIPIKAFVAIAISAIVIFGVFVWTQKESERDRTIRRAQECETTQQTYGGISCEY